jgi:2-dehydropantoate 2-reductase
LRICIAGAGAIGGVLAYRLAAFGHDVHVLARGETLAAIRRTGLQLNSDAAIHVPASEQADGGPADVVFIAVKAHSVASILAAITPIIGPRTLVVPMLNGIPWWYFAGLPAPTGGRIVQAVDPDGHINAALDWKTIIGAVIYITAEAAAPGRVVADPPYRLILGEPQGGMTDRLAHLCAALTSAGFAATPSASIRDDMWTKLVANLASNPLSVVAGATLGEIFGNPDLRGCVMAVMREAMTVGACYGARFTIDPLRLMEVGRQKGAFKTSMLQDFERGRVLELAAIGDAVLELATPFGIAMPTTDMLLSLARFRSQHNNGGV